MASKPNRNWGKIYSQFWNITLKNPITFGQNSGNQSGRYQDTEMELVMVVTAVVPVQISIIVGKRNLVTGKIIVAGYLISMVNVTEAVEDSITVAHTVVHGFMDLTTAVKHHQRMGRIITHANNNH